MEKEPAVAAGNFLFEKTDFVPKISQSPGFSPISPTTEDIPTSIQSEKVDNRELINAEKSVIATTISIKLRKGTHLEEDRTLTKEDKPVEDLSLTEDEEKVRMYYLFLPLFMLLVAFMCLLCILTVLVC